MESVMYEVYAAVKENRMIPIFDLDNYGLSFKNGFYLFKHQFYHKDR